METFIGYFKLYDSELFSFNLSARSYSFEANTLLMEMFHLDLQTMLSVHLNSGCKFQPEPPISRYFTFPTGKMYCLYCMVALPGKKKRKHMSKQVINNQTPKRYKLHISFCFHLSLFPLSLSHPIPLPFESGCVCYSYRHVSQ